MVGSISIIVVRVKDKEGRNLKTYINKEIPRQGISEIDRNLLALPPAR
jgi:hypothetical protein